MRHERLSFLSDYGTGDEFVGVVKSVLHSIAPELKITDLTHDVAPFDVRGASLLLARSAPYLNPGVVLAVVDPGVGTARRAVAVEVGDGASVLIGPDNGLLAPTVAMVGGASRAFDISHSSAALDSPGTTFDGRDLFAPVAAHLAMGADLNDLGSEIDPHLLMPAVLPVSKTENGVTTAEVLWVDRFGNAQLNIDPQELSQPALQMRIGERVVSLRRVRAFEALASGELGLIEDSAGLLSVVAYRDSAQKMLGLNAGVEVTLQSLDQSASNQNLYTAGATVSVNIGKKPDPKYS